MPELWATTTGVGKASTNEFLKYFFHSMSVKLDIMPPASRFGSVDRIRQQDDDDDDDDNNSNDGPDGRDGVLNRLLSPDGAFFATLAKEIASQLASGQRAENLAAMSRPRYIVTQCVTLALALIAVGGLLIFVLAGNDTLVRQLVRVLNGTFHLNETRSEF